MRLVFTIALGIALSLPAHAMDWVSTRNHDLVTPDGRPLILRGFGLGNWLLPEGYMFHLDKANSPRLIRDAFAELVGPDAAADFWREWTDAYITREDVHLIKTLGANSIRVPFNFRMLTPEDHEGVWLEDGFATLDRVIAWAREEGLWIVLDMHAAPGGQTGENIDDSWGNAWLYESPRSQQRTVDIWRKIAERYHDEPTVLGYELLNEPMAHFTDTTRYNPELEPLYKRITGAIREVDKRHVIIVGGAQWNTNFSVFGTPFDPHLVYAFHRYWADPTDIAPFLAFRQQHDVPVWMSESGENTDAWIRQFRETLEKNGIGWSFWPYKKMDSPSCVVQFARPPHWAEIVAYADDVRGATYEEKRKKRPSVQHAREALHGLLQNIRHCTLNRGYVEALGLTPP